MEKDALLKWLLIIGGYFEIVIGILFMFLPYFLGNLGVPAGVPIFIQLAGALFICYGILLVYNGKDIEKYSIIAKTNCLLRLIVQPPAILTMISYPVFIPLLIGTAIYDVGWAIVVLILLKKCDYW